MKPYPVLRACVLSLLFVGPVVAKAQEPPSLLPDALKLLPPRCIGPANMSGRVCEVAVVEDNPSIMYVASASGGVWKTINNGATWTPVFDREGSGAIGAVAVAPSNPDIVWVGTGEGNPRNSVSWGDGVYKSVDGGKTFQHMGLRDSHHIGRIVIHPKNPEIVYVAVLGHLWGPNRERGLYKTSDGGKTWQHSKFINEDTGFIDVAIDPKDPDVLYAAAWQVRRDAFSGGNPATGTGPGSGLFRTTDGGKTWERMTTGLPHRPLGRCGFSIHRKDPNIVYAVIQTDKTTVTVQGQPANLQFRREKNGDGTEVKRKITPDDGGIFRSDDKGKSWVQVNSLCPRPFYYGQIRVDPNDAERVYVLGINFHVSRNGGKTFPAKPGPAPKTHVDYHALWINPRDSNHMVLGCDGGLNFSYDRGQTWEHLKNLPLSQFYQIGVDQRRPYRVYGGLQDNGSWGGPSATWHVEGISYADWFRIFGMDGFYCQVDPFDQELVYVEGQYGRLTRINVRTKQATSIMPRLTSTPKGGKKVTTNIRPEPPPGTPEFRFNWNSPILVSIHQQGVIYFGGNHVFRSEDRGQTWAIISPDLTRGQAGPSASTGHTLTVLAESPLKKGLLWAGSDDGRVHVSGDGGKTWTDVSLNIPGPQERWVSRIVASRKAPTTAYVAITRYRNDDRKPYLFVTADLGQTWQSLAGNLPPGGPIHALCEDPRNHQVLYVGTEFGLFVSADGGKRWVQQRHGFPTVPVHDLVVHPRDQELVIGTHGRGIYIMDVSPLQEWPAVVQTDIHLCQPKDTVAYRPRRSPTWAGTKTFLGSNPPYGTAIYYHLKKASKDQPRLTIIDRAGKPVAELKMPAEAHLPGWHKLQWSLRPVKTTTTPEVEAEMPTVEVGEYVAVLEVGEQRLQKTFRVLGE